MATAVRSTIEAYLGRRADSLLGFHSPKIAKERLHLPGPDFIDRVWAGSDRNIRALINLERLFGHGRLGRTGYMSILSGVLGSVARKYAHKIPFIVKLNHNELLTYPNKFDRVFFGTVEEAYEMGAAAVGATIYFGSEQSDRQIVEVSRAFARAHELGLATVLWCYLRNSAFKKDKDYHVSADLTGQANHLGGSMI
jgi:class I fructose-bisphosphate aldolase